MNNAAEISKQAPATADKVKVKAVVGDAVDETKQAAGKVGTNTKYAVETVKEKAAL